MQNKFLAALATAGIAFNFWSAPVMADTHKAEGEWTLEVDVNTPADLAVANTLTINGAGRVTEPSGVDHVTEGAHLDESKFSKTTGEVALAEAPWEHGGYIYTKVTWLLQGRCPNKTLRLSIYRTNKQTSVQEVRHVTYRLKCPTEEEDIQSISTSSSGVIKLFDF